MSDWLQEAEQLADVVTDGAAKIDLMKARLKRMIGALLAEYGNLHRRHKPETKPTYIKLNEENQKGGRPYWTLIVRDETDGRGQWDTRYDVICNINGPTRELWPIGVYITTKTQRDINMPLTGEVVQQVYEARGFFVAGLLKHSPGLAMALSTYAKAAELNLK